MSWFRRTKRKPDRPAGPSGIVEGKHRSPGFATLCSELDKRNPGALLDLGPSSTENVEFLARFGANVSFVDLFRSGATEEGSRSGRLRFRDVSSVPLPSPEDGLFGAILVWDLLHYFGREQRQDLARRLEGLAETGCLVYIMASAIAPIPPVPLQLKIQSPDELLYVVGEGAAVEPPGLRTRDIEQLMHRFRPLRSFQLRNGLQEFVFLYEGAKTPRQGTSGRNNS